EHDLFRKPVSHFSGSCCLFEHNLFRKPVSHFSGSCCLFEHDLLRKPAPALCERGPPGRDHACLRGGPGSLRRTPRPPSSLRACSPISATPARSSASTTLVSVSTTPRTVPALASIR